MALVGEVQTVVIVTGVVAIKKIDALVIAVETAGMVVDNIQYHGQTVQVTNVDQDLELIDLSFQVRF